MKRDWVVAAFARAIQEDKYLKQRKEMVLRTVRDMSRMGRELLPEEEHEELQDIITKVFSNAQSYSQIAKETGRSKKEIWSKYKFFEEMLGSAIVVAVAEQRFPLFAEDDDFDCYEITTRYLNKYRAGLKKKKKKTKKFKQKARDKICTIFANKN